ncbi:MAG TPA: ABC transporter permease, partial [Bdellovibrionales bacterium]|nr:ABC transporter permease [Bdellovibrionales bacterium]
SQASALAQRLSAHLGERYWVRDWSDINRNLFEAVGLEKTVIFFLLMILVLVASFNLSSQLIVGVVKRYQDIAILKTCGAGPKAIQKIFTWQGLVTGGIGCLAGFILGVVLCYSLEWLQYFVPIVPAEVYKLDHIQLDIRFMDLLLIFSCTLVISFFSTLVPARLGSRMSPVKGLRYD